MNLSDRIRKLEQYYRPEDFAFRPWALAFEQKDGSFEVSRLGNETRYYDTREEMEQHEEPGIIIVGQVPGPPLQEL